MTTATQQATEIWADFATLRSRFSFRFSPTGRSASAWVADGRGAGYVEFWAYTPAAWTCQMLSDTWTPTSAIVESGMPVDPVPFDDGHILLRRDRGSAQELLVRRPGGGMYVTATLDHTHLAVEPAADGSARALLIGRNSDGTGTAWILDGFAAQPRRIAELPPVHLVGGGWYDSRNRRYILHVRVSGRVRPRVLDIKTGALEKLAGTSESANEHVLVTSPATGRCVVATDENDRWQLADLPSGATRGQILGLLEDVDGELLPVAYDPAGRRLLIMVRRGARAGLRVLDLDAGTLRTLPTPEGHTGSPAVWVDTPAGERIHTAHVSPALPFRTLTIDPLTSKPWMLADDGTAGNRSSRWAPGRLEIFPGPAGPIEAIVHGHRDWRAADRVLIALNGGPERPWILKFDQLFQYFSAHGITVVAPNLRGTKGYGDAHLTAIRGRWAGPDLEDVRHLAQTVSAGRHGELLPLYGHSYGAYLAMVAACAEPTLWSRVVAVAPFLSGPRLYSEASKAVRGLLDRLGGTEVVHDDLGPRDLVLLAPRLRCPALIVHGERDDIVPVSQSRTLCDVLRRRGLHEGIDFRYREVAGAGHSPLDGLLELYAEVTNFLLGAEHSSAPST